MGLKILMGMGQRKLYKHIKTTIYILYVNEYNIFWGMRPPFTSYFGGVRQGFDK